MVGDLFVQPVSSAQQKGESMLDLIEKLFLKVKQKFCKHHCRKQYDHKQQRYVYRCIKCGKEP